MFFTILVFNYFMIVLILDCLLMVCFNNLIMMMIIIGLSGLFELLMMYIVIKLIGNVRVIFDIFRVISYIMIASGGNVIMGLYWGWGWVGYANCC